MPQDQTSAADPSYPRPNSTSGAAYDLEPHTCTRGGAASRKAERRVAVRSARARRFARLVTAEAGPAHLHELCENYLPLSVAFEEVRQPKIADLALVVVAHQHILLRGAGEGRGDEDTGCHFLCRGTGLGASGFHIM